MSKPLLCLVVLWLTAHVYAQPTTPTDPGKALMSRDDQRALGLQAAAKETGNCKLKGTIGSHDILMASD
jgi:hypothetical protein